MSPMSRPDQPTFEGRPLARPQDELVDQGAAFDATTLFSRRRMLSVLGIGMGTVALAACGADTTSSSGTTSSGSASASGTATGEIPEETNGPYPADGTQDLNILEQSGIERQDIRTSLDGGEAVAGVALTMAFVVTDMANDKPFEGAAVYAWQCDAEGRYSMYSDGVTDQTWLRGVQVADADGKVSFTTIVPGCYSGRWPHIHFEVYPDKASATDVDNVIATSQVAFPQDMLTPIYARSEYGDSARNMASVGSVEDDMIFSDSLDLQTPTITGSIDAGYTATLKVGVDTTTEPSAGGGGGMPGGGPGGGQPPAPRS
ncbi:intradiol ring-cleavage dioxygenase [Knoellia flava]|uniref:3,4-dioxygenase subunit beta n=2 Tax=Knoellia flava TaxID=913969 RepID=A0A8H9KSM9_9MICO|nr:intradiol ring-cleavage dioxygenase [Knoellia flava]GGB91103.1 3,4-dioxygenase subunit beta [Knoellia flava]